MKIEEVGDGWLYFKKNGKIEVEEIVQHGSIELVCQDGKVIYVNKTIKRKL